MEALKLRFDDLDPILHEPTRMGIAATISSEKELTFGEIKRALDLTDGNLSVHLQKLEKAGYVRIDKQFVDRRPQTSVRLTTEGKRAFADYLEKLENIVKRSKRQGGRA